MNTTEPERYDNEGKCCDNDHDNSSSCSIDERKPAAIQYSSIDSGRVTTTVSATMEIATATATKKDDREISRSKNPQIQVENNDEKKNTTNDINDFNSNNYYNENNNDDDDDDDDGSLYDDWVEGNWCLLDNSDNSNEEVEGKGNDDDNSPRNMQHEVTTTPVLRKKSRKNNNDSARRNLKRSRYDDDDDSYNKDDEDDDKKEEEEFIPKDNKSVHNHDQEDKRPVKKRSQQQTHYDNHCDQIWMGMFRKLVEYKKQHKNTIVPNNYKNNPKLGLWVFTQRRCCRNDKLIPNRYALLDSIGFEWDGIKCKAVTDQIKWMNMFQKLVAYRKQHTTTMVPKIYEEDPPLGRWVETQREVYRKDKLLPNRCALLKSIGFNLDAYNENYQQLWMGMFQKLLAYKEQHKNTTEPNQKSKLGRWVCKQRYFYNRGELLPARIALLKSIGFT